MRALLTDDVGVSVFHQKFGLLHTLLDVLIIGPVQIDLLNHANLLAFNVKSLVYFPESTAAEIVTNIELFKASISIRIRKFG